MQEQPIVEDFVTKARFDGLVLRYNILKEKHYDLTKINEELKATIFELNAHIENLTTS